jgi:hypothetical protein
VASTSWDNCVSAFAPLLGQRGSGNPSWSLLEEISLMIPNVLLLFKSWSELPVEPVCSLHQRISVFWLAHPKLGPRKAL